MSSLNRKITPNKTKYLLKMNWKSWKHLIQFISKSYFGKSHFEQDGMQNYLVFQPIQIHFERIVNVGNDNYMYYWKSKGLSDETIDSIKTSDYGITPYLSYYHTNKIRVKFDEGCLKQDQAKLLHRGIVNVYIVYEKSNINVSNYPTLENCLFGAVESIKNADLDKYGYSGYRIGFDTKGSFSFPGTGLGRNVIIFGVDMSSSTKTDNRKNDILVLEKGPTQGLEHTLSPEKMYSINFTEKN